MDDTRLYHLDACSQAAAAFIDRHAGKPFFLYLALNTPHSPMQVPHRWWKKFKNKKLEKHNRDPKKEQPLHQRAALAMCENIDWNVGRLLSTLDQQQLADNTIKKCSYKARGGGRYIASVPVLRLCFPLKNHQSPSRL